MNNCKLTNELKDKCLLDKVLRDIENIKSTMGDPPLMKSHRLVICKNNLNLDPDTDNVKYIENKCAELGLESVIVRHISLMKFWAVSCDCTRPENNDVYHVYNDVRVWPKNRNFIHSKLTRFLIGFFI
jgi:hypothetical protein